MSISTTPTPTFSISSPTAHTSSWATSQGLVEGTDYYGTTDASSGAVQGYVEDTYDEYGQDPSTVALQAYYQYATITGGGISIYPVSAETVYSNATADPSDPAAAGSQVSATWEATACIS